MPYSIKLDGVPAGYAANAAKEGEQANIIVREFTSSEDGDLFIGKLDGFPLDLISKLPAEASISPSNTDHLLAIIQRDQTATIYVNELDMILRIQAKHNLRAGDAVYDDDIADILKLGFKDIIIPDDAGLAFIFSIGWRKGFFYDFGPLASAEEMRSYNPEEIFGHYFAYLSRQHLFKITETEWQQLFEQQWFPFVTLKSSTVKKMLSYLRSNWQVDELIQDISDEVAHYASDMRDRWSKNIFIEPHFEIIQRAIDRYIAKDYVSTVSILYPRIEGVMRSVLMTSPDEIKASQRNLVASVIDSRQQELHQYSSLLPAIFQRFLREVYFANFDPNLPAKLSRNSIAHGVASPQDYSLKGATIGLLTLDQIFFYLP